MERQLKQEQVNADMALVQKASLSQLKKPRALTLVTDSWLPQYDEVRTRYTFLALVGEFRFGRRVYAEHDSGGLKVTVIKESSTSPQPSQLHDTHWDADLLADDTHAADLDSSQQLYSINRDVYLIHGSSRCFLCAV